MIDEMKDVNWDLMFAKCYNIALIGHKGQYRKMGDDKGKPYIVHPERIAGQFANDKIRACISILHDLIEDTSWTAKMLEAEGIPACVIEGVLALTKQEGENYLQFVLRAKANPLARLVKIEDIKDNTTSLQEGSLKDKYRLALYILEN